MSAWIATALTIAVSAMSAITAVNAGSCAPGTTQNCLHVPGKLDFSEVPVISQQIVSGEKKTTQKPKEQASEPSALAPYTGPIFGASPRPGRTPVVGYSWSLE
jgi:hypothetical protein